MKISNSNVQDLLVGSTFFGTGGGGNPEEANQIYSDIFGKGASVEVKQLSDFDDDQLFITSFGVGSITRAGNPDQVIGKALTLLQKNLSGTISGVIPVEIGPKAIATAIQTADILGLPIVDADFVGGRAAPEVFLETISLYDLPRTPAVVINIQGNAALLESAPDFKFEEDFMRSFAIMSGNEQAYVLGYPLTKKQLVGKICTKTISKSVQVGAEINSSLLPKVLTELQGKVFFEGTISRVKKEEKPGFLDLTVSFTSDSGDTAKLYLRNENLIFWLNGAPTISCPDLIVLVDDKMKPVYNLDLKEGMQIKVLGLPSEKLWRTKEGLSLFSPQTFGFSFAPVLVK